MSHTVVLAIAKDQPPIAIGQGEDLKEPAVIAFIAAAVLSLGPKARAPGSAVVVIRNGSVVRHVHSKELESLYDSLIEAAVSTTRAWWTATEPRR